MKTVIIVGFCLPHLQRQINIVPNLSKLLKQRSCWIIKYKSLSKGMNVSVTTICEEEEELTNNNNNKNNFKIIRLEEGAIESLAKNAAHILKSGGVIGVPTDTVYGVAVDAQNNDAISKIYSIKGRDFKKPIAICVSSIEEVYLWGKVGGGVPQNLLTDLLPGPVTLIFERQSRLNPHLNPSTNLIGIRIPDHKFIQDLAKLMQGPIALTSANFSAFPSTLEVQEFKELWPSLDLVFDGGRLSSCEKTEKAARAGSTVIDLSIDGYYRIIREGTAYAECVQILSDKYKFKKTEKD
jgi:tRNA threonylcarbamoyl adenosine modification protein (Sua5/YciO/YrdC/YwlC family)